MFEPVAAATAQGVPVIVGTNRDEFALYARDHPLFGKPFSEDDLKKDLAPDFKDPGVDTLLAAYRQSRPAATPWELMVAIRSNRFHVSATRLAEAQSKVAPTYLYSFDYAPTGQSGHGSEISFVFSNATANPNAPAAAKAVETAMSEAWIAFARTGNPNHPGLPSWPTYNTDTRPAMVFDAKTAVVNDIRAPERKVWEGKPVVR
jgi:para-nitrobenzyl esterase